MKQNLGKYTNLLSLLFLYEGYFFQGIKIIECFIIREKKFTMCSSDIKYHQVKRCKASV